MRIVVDELPEHPDDCFFCKFHIANGSTIGYICGLPNPVWTPCLAEQDEGCPYLVEQSKYNNI